jgi:hypothetical protein
MIKAIALSVFMAFFISGCTSYHSNTSETMRPLASALTKLSSETEALVRYGNLPPTATEEELLNLATKNDPSFLNTFKGYTLHAFSQDRHVIILLCTEDQEQGLLEDLGCTASLDRNLWKEDAVMPCEFTLSVELGCQQR